MVLVITYHRNDHKPIIDTKPSSSEHSGIQAENESDERYGSKNAANDVLFGSSQHRILRSRRPRDSDLYWWRRCPSHLLKRPAVALCNYVLAGLQNSSLASDVERMLLATLE